MVIAGTLFLVIFLCAPVELAVARRDAFAAAIFISNYEASGQSRGYFDLVSRQLHRRASARSSTFSIQATSFSNTPGRLPLNCNFTRAFRCYSQLALGSSGDNEARGVWRRRLLPRSR